jgi:hypothetical protein
MSDEDANSPPVVSVLETMPRTMCREVRSMRVAQAAKRRCCVDAEGLACSDAELRPNERRAVVGETDEALVVIER